MKLWQKGNAAHQKVDHFTVGSDREYDLLLAAYDCEASSAHAQMLAKIGLLTKEEANLVTLALNNLKKKALEGSFTIEDEFEDMHSKIEHVLTDQLGDLGKKIHTARSRNDQVLVAMHLYLKNEITGIKKTVIELFDLLMSLAEQHKNELIPGYTHLQVAMPSSFGMWFSAYAESLIDDVQFLNTAFCLVDQNPLGSAAGYGSSFPIDREYTTEALNFGTLKYNSVAAQMSRGKVEKTTAVALSMVGSTLSKFAMDVCLYMGQDFNFVSFPDDLTTGSSIMPHKKNPDIFELIRGKCNALQALPTQLTLLTTNLPSGYHRELQLAKGPIIDGIQELKACLDMLLFSLPKIEVSKNITDQSKYDYLFSVDTLNAKVQDGMPFRDAYRELGNAIENGDYDPNRSVEHTHLGSIGNLGLEQIREKMNGLR
ncbi:argininosuccinate lyase [Flavobacteriaceae bacterium]|uniref:argininosuccinate lyase n=1 Tax=Candidatus Arcticimaribacter forsetii TaxID=2820661 RepID=UPI00207705EC|nr:argininosuccinate lyase [Candidatus Arcticimaribacter forsetii]MDA8698977.1 argininosuccinate lyase [Flavobacteriaceae bacterium]MDB2329377.1 argininosuccinate lyase [Flavobacteriaceae bacterium]MDB2345599.1 argininosuccinate lyase [Flavobacteriaceae bacterium]MDB4716787.1 argininosuccinate lyase [Flavobacteriaceae bacterium]